MALVFCPLAPSYLFLRLQDVWFLPRAFTPLVFSSSEALCISSFFFDLLALPAQEPRATADI